MTEEEKKIEFTQEDLDDISKDIQKAKEALKPEEKQAPLDADKLREEIKAELIANMESEKEAKAKEDELANTKKALEETKNKTESELNALKAKIDSMAESKAVVNVKSPFDKDHDTIDKIMSDPEKLRAIDEASRKEFEKQRG